MSDATDPTDAGAVSTSDVGAVVDLDVSDAGDPAAGHANDAAGALGSCANAWTQPDPGCPSPDNASAFGAFCAPLGIRCLSRLQTPDPVFIAQMCEFPPSASGPLWTFQAPIYEPSDFDARPNEIALDTTDCSARPLTSCDCPFGDLVTTEGLLNYDSTLWEATYGNPRAYVAFTDDGCAARVRYGNETPATADFASKLGTVYGARRWSCASSGTHFLMFHTVRPIGPN